MPVLSAVIITLNEAANIARCIEALLPVADEIIVADTGSNDQTIAICQQYPVKLIQLDWQGYAATKNQANTAASGDFILSIDADEVLSDELSAAIINEKGRLSGAYRFNRLTSFAGEWIRHCGWYPDRKIRLFPKTQARWTGDFVHEKLELNPGTQVSFLPGDILHYSYRSVEDYLQRMERYARLGAEELQQKGRKASWYHLHLKPAIKFLSVYFYKRGFLDGKAGLTISRLSARAIRLKYLKLREMNQH